MAEGFIEKRREEVIDVLTDAFARDLIDTEEYERRVGKAHELSSIPELNALAADLRPLFNEDAKALSLYPAAGDLYLKTYFASQHYDGNWLTNENVELRAIMGSMTCDFRRPVLGPRTTVNLRVIMGDVKIIIPRGLRISVEVTPILGDVTRQRGDNRFVRQVKGIISSFLGGEESRELINPNSHPAAEIVITGSIFMGSLKIIEKDESLFS